MNYNDFQNNTAQISIVQFDLRTVTLNSTITGNTFVENRVVRTNAIGNG